MTGVHAAEITGAAIVAGWIIGLAAMYIALMYGPDMADNEYP